MDIIQQRLKQMESVQPSKRQLKPDLVSFLELKIRERFFQIEEVPRQSFGEVFYNVVSTYSAYLNSEILNTSPGKVSKDYRIR